MAGWSDVYPIGKQAVHLVLLKNKKLFLHNLASPGAYTWDWLNPSTAAVPIPNSPDRVFCSGHCALSDGKILFAGGDYDGSGNAPTQAYIYDPSGGTNGTWSDNYPMNLARYYPTCTMLPTGKVLVFSGRAQNAPQTEQSVPEVFSPATDPPSWTQYSNAQFYLSYPPMYPWMFNLPNGTSSTGKMFWAGPSSSENTGVLDTSSTNPANWTWPSSLRYAAVSDGEDQPGYAGGGAGCAVMYRPGKILKCGGDHPGGEDAVDLTAVIDLTADTSGWALVDPMNRPRRHHRLVMLPNGKILCLGGNTCGQIFGQHQTMAEIYDPSASTPQWTDLEAEDYPRCYHSTAALLPDGRVLSAGGNKIADTDWFETGQIYSPDYRDGTGIPTITQSGFPATMSYNTNYTVNYTPTGTNISKVTLTKLAATTHWFDQDQRYLELTVSGSGGSLTVTSPSGPTWAPPGYYLLWLVDSNGKVSTAGELVKLQL